MAHDAEIAQLSSEIALESPTRDADASRNRRELRVSAVKHDGIYVRIWLDAPPAYREAHLKAGQYITARFGASRHRFLVLANAPHESAKLGYELLVEPNEDLAPVLNELAPGDTVLASGPEGDGFPSRLEGKAVALVATGSGIAGVRPVLAHWRERPELRPASVVLYYEEEAGIPHAFREELEGWSSEGWLEVRFVTHEPGEPFVADLIDYEAMNVDFDVMLCGAPPMIAAVSSRALACGVGADRIHTNI